MVTTFRYYSFKELDFARRRPAGVLVLVVLAVLIVATHPQWFLFLLLLGLRPERPDAPAVGAPRVEGSAHASRRERRDAH